MSAEKFWYGWLKITILIIILSGLFLVLTGSLIHLSFIDAIVEKLFFAGTHPLEEETMLKNWFFGISGVLMAGWGIFMLYLVNHSFQQKQQWAWKCIFYPIVIWYILDTSISMYFSVFFNVLLNSILFLQMLAPLLYLRNQFFNKLQPST
jgi:hypothetical protein